MVGLGRAGAAHVVLLGLESRPNWAVVGPVGPVGPVEPVVPVDPVGPVEPVLPVGPITIGGRGLSHPSQEPKPPVNPSKIWDKTTSLKASQRLDAGGTIGQVVGREGPYVAPRRIPIRGYGYHLPRTGDKSGLRDVLESANVSAWALRSAQARKVGGDERFPSDVYARSAC